MLFTHFLSLKKLKTISNLTWFGHKSEIDVDSDEQSIKNGNNYTKTFIDKYGPENSLIISADIENQINELNINEKKNYMEMIGLKKTGLDLLIKKGYKILELENYFT